MVKKTFHLRDEDARKLISYACRYRSVTTVIDEASGIMTVSTTFADNDKPTSLADRFELVKTSDDPPKMPEEEYRRRVEGKFPG